MYFLELLNLNSSETVTLTAESCSEDWNSCKGEKKISQIYLTAGTSILHPYVKALGVGSHASSLPKSDGKVCLFRSVLQRNISVYMENFSGKAKFLGTLFKVESSSFYYFAK